jgi:hypothetical protein
MDVDDLHAASLRSRLTVGKRLRRSQMSACRSQTAGRLQSRPEITTFVKPLGGTVSTLCRDGRDVIAVVLDVIEPLGNVGGDSAIGDRRVGDVGTAAAIAPGMIAAGHVGGLSIPRTSFKALVDALSEAARVVDEAGTPVSETEQAEVAETSATAMHRWAAFNVPAFQSSAPPCRKPLHRISRDLDRLNSPTSTAP